VCQVVDPFFQKLIDMSWPSRMRLWELGCVQNFFSIKLADMIPILSVGSLGYRISVEVEGF